MYETMLRTKIALFFALYMVDQRAFQQNFITSVGFLEAMFGGHSSVL
jgi:hypothetical protein